ncbi:sterol desaturase family protein [Dolichospermum circinale]|uniref:sterol desaturase family protein n=1 Tax=Dolichospermum circinale TaxID=109265 RepID=UPI00041F9B53|nr:sterol desaturase family protein [Dolichospermum circinale]MDB9475047.1 sterol desaturase family protein [Dolichospermum circinale CS-537/11]MDB9480055.1 sterol desaturase family protein [Dolichospermum circinale CS-537/03]MDB9484308.1 sterol desaturase family protein [Dolichospermum circinale CS-537/05]
MRNTLLYWLMLFASGTILWFWEKHDPLRQLEYKSVFIKEFTAASISFTYGIINTYTTWMLLGKILVFPANFIESTGLLSLPIWVRIIAAYILKEFLYYVIHRAQHANKYLWLTHCFHHSSNTVWWLSAQRVSLISAMLYTVSYIGFPLLQIPRQFMMFVLMHLAFQDNWIHLNVKWRPWMRILEWVYVTPRFHSIHHYDFEGKNLGDTLTIFDRLFSTYLEPDTYQLDPNQSASNNEPITAKMILGI